VVEWSCKTEKEADKVVLDSKSAEELLEIPDNIWWDHEVEAIEVEVEGERL
jgi:hypothetical protein